MTQKKEQMEYLPASDPQTLMMARHEVLLVGAIGFEPTTPGPPCQCATRLRHAPNVPGLQVRGNVSAAIGRSLSVPPLAVAGNPDM